MHCDVFLWQQLPSGVELLQRSLQHHGLPSSFVAGALLELFWFGLTPLTQVLKLLNDGKLYAINGDGRCSWICAWCRQVEHLDNAKND